MTNFVTFRSCLLLRKKWNISYVADQTVKGRGLLLSSLLNKNYNHIQTKKLVNTKQCLSKRPLQQLVCKCDSKRRYSTIAAIMSKRTDRGSTKKSLSDNRSEHSENSASAGDGPSVSGQRSGDRSRRGRSHHHTPGGARSQQNRTPQRTTPQSKGGRPRSGKNTPCAKGPPPQQREWTMGEIDQGLKSGRMIQGELRVNPRDYKSSYVTHPDGGNDVMIEGLELRKPALAGDLVVVEIIKGFEQETEKPESTKQLESLVQALVINKDKGASSQPGDKDAISQPEDNGASSLSGDKGASSLSGDKGASSLSGEISDSDQPDVIIEEDTTTMITPEVPKGNSISASSSSPPKKVHRMGRVVTILQMKHNRICAGYIKPNKTGDRVVFSPNDSRVPRILLPKEDCPQDIFTRPDDYKNVVYAAKLVDWPADSMFAEGKLMCEIGQNGQVDTMIEAYLMENNIDTSEFNSTELASIAVKTPWVIPSTEIDKRRDFRKQCVFTIDPSTARDLDDALSISKLDDGTFDVGVHIADVSYFLHELTPLDDKAEKRATSVYLPNKVIPMLPRVLCEDLCSLNPDEDRLTFSVVWNISEEGEVYKEWFGRSVIRSCVKLSYEHAQGFITDPEKDWTVDELPPISTNFNVGQIKESVLNLNKIAVNLRQKRKEGGSLNLHQKKLSFNLDDKTGLPNGFHSHESLHSHKLVEEFMLLANMAVAHKIHKSFPERAMLRRHPEPSSPAVVELENHCKQQGIPLDFSSSLTLQKSLDDMYKQDPEKYLVITSMCSRPMQMALYFCNGCLEDETLYRHYALSVPLYTHFTSPIRRYVDVMVHRALAASLDYSELTLGKEKLQAIAEHCNGRKKAAKVASDMCIELFFSAFVQEVGKVEGIGMVMAVLDHSVDVYFINLGLTKRVYIDHLPLKTATYMDGKLTLVWKKEEGMKGEITQCLSVFTKINCSITKGNAPLTWMAILQRPEEEDSVKSE